jgi:hypothetical protein
MTTIAMATIERQYKNNGQHAEQVFRYTVSGVICKADNKPSTVSGDYEDIQIKSARATICKGNDIASHLATDKAERYAYVTNDFKVAYIMSKAEYLAFATMFATLTRESQANGGAEKMRFKSESKAMLEWLRARV